MLVAVLIKSEDMVSARLRTTMCTQSLVNTMGTVFKEVMGLFTHIVGLGALGALTDIKTQKLLTQNKGTTIFTDQMITAIFICYRTMHYS